MHVSKKNQCNGTVKRTMKTQLGEIDVNVLYNRDSEIEACIISKYQRNVDGYRGMYPFIIYGMSIRDIKDLINGCMM